MPNGYDSSGNLLLSVIIAPELAGGTTGTLADWSDFSNWPNLLETQALDWIIEFSSADFLTSASAAVSFSSTSGNLNPSLWTELFPSSVVYGPREPLESQFRSLAVASYPALQISGFLLGQYQSYSPAQEPTIETLQGVYGPITDVLVGVAAGGAGRSNRQFERLAAERAARSQGGTVPAANDFSAASAADAFAAQAYYHLPGAGTQPPPGIVGTVDFHKALTFVSQHGVLQRALGLVFDLSIPTGSITNYGSLFTATTSDVFVSVSLTAGPQGGFFEGNPPGDYYSINPRTHCDASTTVFEAHPATANIAPGRQLAVAAVDPQTDATRYLAHTIDIDGAGLRASNFATQIRLAESPGTIDPAHVAAYIAPDLATPMTPPMIRSNGLTLTEVNRGVNFAAALSRAFLLVDATAAYIAEPDVAPSPPDLTAEDLLRGFVLDVNDQADNVWRSTAERIAQYTAPTVTAISSPSSAPFDEASAQAPPRSQSSPTDESTQQANLSEVILRYNGWSNAAPLPGTVLQDADSQAGGANPQGPFPQLTIDVSVPAGRLPPLRFGHSYAMRARIVDVANNAVSLTQGADVGDGLGRVTTPMVYGRHEPIGSPDIYSQSTPRLAESLMRLVVRDIDGPGTSMRALAPQRCAAPFAEWHGMFDSAGQLDPNSASGDQTIYTEIISRESAHYPEPATPPTPIDLTSSVPFLPDPLAKGAVIVVVEGSLSGNSYTFDFSQPQGGPGGPRGGDWPGYQPFGLKLVPGTTPSATVDSTNRVLTFTITPADTVTTQLSSTCDVADVDPQQKHLFALADLFPSGSFDPSAAAQGMYWAITPFATVELIYAVQKPLLTPEFPSFPTPARALGSTFAPLQAEITYSPKSTSKIDLLASWGDPVDDPIDKLPVQGPGAPNPKLRQTTDSPVATMPSTVTPLASAGTQDASATDSFAVRHEFHDTKHRNVTYSAVATSQFTEFYAPGTDVTVDTAHPVTVNILSTARPDSPRLAAVVPIYGWKPIKHTGRTIVSERPPSALRVFIERPWWSSGIDELLGVVTWPDAENRIIVLGPVLRGRHARRSDRARPSAAGPGGFVGGGTATTIPDDQALYVTDWGADPVFQSGSLPSAHPRMSSFTKATKFGTGLSIEENSTMQVNVAGHDVRFDATRGLWYADIAVDTGAAYTPMIRLALARYQPNSVAGAELSRIVLADIVSLEPGRTVSVVRKSSTHLSSVILSGYSYARAAGDGSIAPGVAEITIERRVPGIADQTLGWEQIGQPLRMTSSTRGGLTTWVAKNIALPTGQCRLSISQYELLPTDNRQQRTGFYLLPTPSRDVRLLHQDVIPL